MLWHSTDEGRSWQGEDLDVWSAGADWGEPPDEPDAHGRLFRHIGIGESPDGRLVLLHQTPYAEAPERDKGWFRGRSQLCARLSDEGGDT